MRVEYWRLGLKALRDGKLPWLLRQTAKLVTVRLGNRLGRPVAGPILGSILVTYRCNNRCLMCDYPRKAGDKKREGASELTTAQLKQALDDFAALGTTGMAFTGGEPLLRKDIHELLVYARSLSMVTNINSNGCLLAREEHAIRLLETGVDLINISVDGCEADTHDYLRQTPGGFEKLRAGVQNLLRLRARYNPRVVVNMVSVLSARNIHEAERLAVFSRELGCDHIGFMPVKAFEFMGEDLLGGDPAWLEEARRMIDTLKLRRRELRIDSSDEYLDRFIPAFRGEENDLRCYAGYHSLMLDPYGDVFPCFPYVEWGRALGNIMDTPLRELWRSRAYNEVRKEIAVCRACFWNCHTELNLLFN